MSAKPNAQAGFSLVETVAAMGILAIAALPLMQVASDATRNTSRLESRMLARSVAENVMARELSQPAALDGGLRTGTETQLGRVYEWRLTISPPVPGEVQGLDVRVNREGDTQEIASLVALKVVPRPVEPVPEDPDPSPPVEGTQ